MSSVSKEQIWLAKQMGLLEYLQRFEPDELVPHGRGEFVTRAHSSLVISNGKWIWNKHGIGGRSALDYLVKVRGIDFVQAVEHLCGASPASFLPAGGIRDSPEFSRPENRSFVLPPRHHRTTKLEAYLKWRGLDSEIVRECIRAGILYESKKEHGSNRHYNCVFVGRDKEKVPRYAMLRGAFSAFRGEAAGSDKRFSFQYRPESHDGVFTTVFVCESAIDALSAATLRKRDAGAIWRDWDYLSLGGTSPVALRQYLTDNPHIGQVCLGLDNDEAGRAATDSITRELEAMGITVSDVPPPCGKDYNRALMMLREQEKQMKSNKNYAR